MFLDLTLKRNPELIEAAFILHQNGLIEPDTYLLDLDNIIRNASIIKNQADKYGIRLYFMTKQFGRNPFVAKRIDELGYDGAVAVDYREANLLYRNGIKIGNVGHLVQVPSRMVEGMLEKKPGIVTVYSYDKAKEISAAAKRLGIVQNIMLRVVDDGDVIYPGQAGGFHIENLADEVSRMLELPDIRINGVTSFPCFIVDTDIRDIRETNNLNTVLKAKEIIENNFGIKISEVNLPSVTCCQTIQNIAHRNGTHGEPGHGLTGTTPLHVLSDQPEVPSMVYVSEVSHIYDGISYCYGGGYYRRSFMENAIVGTGIDNFQKVEIDKPDASNIDYYIGLKCRSNVGDTAILSFRTQIFVTRSRVAVVEGIRSGCPRITGIYDSLGQPINEGI